MSYTKPLYDTRLANEWIDWVETNDPAGSREQDIYPYIKKWLAEVRPRSLADIGCGQGVCSTLVAAGTAYIGIDDAPVLIERAQKLYSEERKRFILGDVVSVPLEDSSLEAVLSVWVWSHLGDIESAAREMHRILKPGGSFLVITANPGTYDIRKSFYKNYHEDNGLLIGTFDLGNGRALTDSTLYLHTMGRMKEAIADAGLTITDIKKLGQLDQYPAGLYIAIRGRK